MCRWVFLADSILSFNLLIQSYSDSTLAADWWTAACWPVHYRGFLYPKCCRRSAARFEASWCNNSGRGMENGLSPATTGHTILRCGHSSTSHTNFDCPFEIILSMTLNIVPNNWVYIQPFSVVFKHGLDVGLHLTRFFWVWWHWSLPQSWLLFCLRVLGLTIRPWLITSYNFRKKLG